MLKLDQFSRDGFLILDEFLSTSTVKELLSFLDGLPFEHAASRIRRGTVFARRNLLRFDFIQQLIERGEIVDLVEKLAPGSMAVRAILFDKTGAANWTVPWHQDRAIAVREKLDVAGFGPWSQKAGIIHVQPPIAVLREMLTLRFHIDACGIDSGPLRVIAGTHNRLLDQSEIEMSVGKDAQSVCEVAAGGVLAMRPLLLHASSPAKMAVHRRVVHIEFGPAQLPGGLEWAVA